LMFREASALPENNAMAREELYGRARYGLAERMRGQKSLKSELRALEFAIRSVERSPHAVIESRAATSLLILSVMFPGLWLTDITGVSLFWVVRPWYPSMIGGRFVGKGEKSFLKVEVIQMEKTTSIVKSYFRNDHYQSMAERMIPAGKIHFSRGHHKLAAGLLCGGILIGLVIGASVWRTSEAERTPTEAAIYDNCLVALYGSTTACDAVVRTYRRETSNLHAKVVK
jgi:hypothetical protein